MKKIMIYLVASLIVASFCFTKCSKEVDQEIKPVAKINLDTLTFSHSVKGWELYSRPDGDDWNYAFLIGTNRLKTYEEVTANPIIVTGLDSLKMLLDKFPEKEEILLIGEGWLERCWGGSYANLSMPGEVTVNEIMAYCIQKKLVLSISE